MMKQAFSLLLGISIVAALIFSCKKDEEPVEESPFFEFFAESLIDIDTTPVAADTWEYGFVFTALRSGTVEKLGLKLPVTGEFDVRLWDLSGSTPVLIRNEKITSAAKHEPAFMGISPVFIEKGVKMGVTIKANAFYRLQKKNGSNFLFPRVVRNIRIESFNETLSAASDSFPPMANDKRVAPCVNVIFIAD